MNPNKFEDLTNRILGSENLHNLQSTRYNRNLIDKNLLGDSQSFVSFDRQSVKLKNSKVESTDQMALRVRKCNDLNERIKKFAKNMKKPSKQRDTHCDLHHQNVKPSMDKSMLLNKLNEQVSPDPDLNSLLKRDEAVLLRHKTNIEKLNRLMEAVKGYNYVEASLPAAETVNESIAFLRETVNDVDYLNESDKMYSGLTKQTSGNLYKEEIKDLSNHLYM